MGAAIHSTWDQGLQNQRGDSETLTRSAGGRAEQGTAPGRGLEDQTVCETLSTLLSNQEKATTGRSAPPFPRPRRRKRPRSDITKCWQGELSTAARHARMVDPASPSVTPA